MAAKTDPGSYAVHDEPFDTYNGTYVPLRTPHGPITVHFMNADHVLIDSGYQTREYGEIQIAHTSDRNEAFTWKGAEVCGYTSFWRTAHGWTVTPPPDHVNNVSFGSRGRRVTHLMTQEIVGYWAAVIARYVAEHPHIPAHAAFRASVKSLHDQEEAVRKAEEELTAMRRTRARIRREVRRAFTADYTLGEPGAMDAPRTYHDDSTYTNGYVVELKNDPELMRSLDAQRDAANGQEK